MSEVEPHVEVQTHEEGILIEEFKALKHEIDQNNRDVFSILEISLTASVAVFAIAFTNAVVESYRWLIVLVPWVILFPSTMMITQRARHTWIIGRYIQLYLEPKLKFQWERVNFGRKMNQVKRNKRVRFWNRYATFAGSTTGILLITQAICIVLSLISFLPLLFTQSTTLNLKINFGVAWFLLSSLIIWSISIQRAKINEVNNPFELLSEYFPELNNEK